MQTIPECTWAVPETTFHEGTVPKRALVEYTCVHINQTNWTLYADPAWLLDVKAPWDNELNTEHYKGGTISVFH